MDLKAISNLDRVEAALTLSKCIGRFAFYPEERFSYSFAEDIPMFCFLAISKFNQYVANLLGYELKNDNLLNLKIEDGIIQLLYQGEIIADHDLRSYYLACVEAPQFCDILYGNVEQLSSYTLTNYFMSTFRMESIIDIFETEMSDSLFYILKEDDGIKYLSSFMWKISIFISPNILAAELTDYLIDNNIVANGQIASKVVEKVFSFSEYDERFLFDLKSKLSMPIEELVSELHPDNFRLIEKGYNILLQSALSCDDNSIVCLEDMTYFFNVFEPKRWLRQGYESVSDLLQIKIIRSSELYEYINNYPKAFKSEYPEICDCLDMCIELLKKPVFEGTSRAFCDNFYTDKWKRECSIVVGFGYEAEYDSSFGLEKLNACFGATLMISDVLLRETGKLYSQWTMERKMKTGDIRKE